MSGEYEYCALCGQDIDRRGCGDCIENLGGDEESYWAACESVEK